MRLVLSGFMGVAPKYYDAYIKDGYANRSVNTRSGRAVLEAWRGPVEEATTVYDDPATIYEYLPDEWFEFKEPASVVRAPIKNDPWHYAIICQEGKSPQLAYALNAVTGGGAHPTVTYDLGVPVPIGAPVWLKTEEADHWYQNDELANPPVEGGEKPTPPPEEDEYDIQHVSYSFCYYDAWGRLSAMSDPSPSIEIKEWGYVNASKVTMTLPPPPENLLQRDTNRNSFAKVRIYRTNFAGDAASVWQFVKEVDISALEFTDQTYSGDLLDSPINEFWSQPPNTNTALFPNGTMKRVAVVGADILAGHNSRLVCFAEPEAFYAWPAEYYKVFEEDIVTIQSAGSDLVVLTTGFPYVLSGAHPSAMQETRLAQRIPCVNEFATVEVAGSVYFVSTRGMFVISGYQLSNVTGDFLSEEQFEALVPSTMKMATYDEKIILQSETGVTYLYDPAVHDSGLRELGLNASCYVQQGGTNNLLYVEKDSNVIKRFDSDNDSHMPLEWTSKLYEMMSPIGFPVLRIRAENYPVTVEIEYSLKRGFTQRQTVTVYDDEFVYTGIRSRAKTWQVRIKAQTPQDEINVYQILLGQRPSEVVDG